MTLKERLRQPGTVSNVFMTLPVPFLAERMGLAGLESITLDLQHGAIESAHLLGLVQAIHAGGVPALARLAWNRPELIMNALDHGIEGLICPMIESAADTAAFVKAAKYPPAGNRSFGPFRAALRHGGDYFREANDTTVCLAMIETAGAVKELDAIAATPGLDGLYVGPWDLSASLGLKRQGDLTDPELTGVIDRVLALCRERGLVSGIFTVRPEDARSMADRGFDLVTWGTEMMLFERGLGDWQQFEM